MKKIILGILSVFMIMGGVLLSACEKKVSLSVSAEEVVIFTNDQQAENYQSKEVKVTLQNSSFGIKTEILKGGDSIILSEVRRGNSSNYFFDIYGEKSGEAEIKVYSVEDNSQSKIISVKVNTNLEEIKTLKNDNQDAKSDLFVVKGKEKNLAALDYFEFKPLTANICDVKWSIEGENVEGASVTEDGKLLVEKGFKESYITLKAAFAKNDSIFNTIKLEVLEDSTINSFELDGKTLYQNNVVAMSGQVDYNLKRNNSEESFIEGKIVVNTAYEVELNPVFYEKLENGEIRGLNKSEYEKFFSFDILSQKNNNGMVECNFKIDAIDAREINLNASYYFALEIGYKDYNYSVSTQKTATQNGVEILLETTYSATRVELLDSQNDVINNNVIDVFSSYSTGNGFKLTTNVLPSIALPDYVNITVDLMQTSLKNLYGKNNLEVSDFVKFYYRGEELKFEKTEAGSSVYKTSQKIEAGSNVFVASEKNVNGVVFNFVAESNGLATTSLTMNLYKISADEILETTDSLGEDIPEITYISSSFTSSRTATFDIKIKGISTLSGLSLKTEQNSKFKYSELERLDSNDSENDTYLIVRFVVSLNDYNFDDTTTFWFEHITGKVSEKYKLNAFVPINSVTVQNGDKSSSAVYQEKQEDQNFILKGNGIVGDNEKTNNSLSRLMLESGVSLSINVDCNNASLTEEKIKYKFLSYEKFLDAIKVVENLVDQEEIEIKANDLFTAGLDTIPEKYYNYFSEDYLTYFSINNGKIVLTDNAFKGYVCVLVYGYNEKHEETVLARFFALESFYSVEYLSPSKKTVLLYSSETLSISDMNRSKVDITISMRPDEKVPTYSNNLDYLTFVSAIDNNFDCNEDKTYLKNSYYELNDIRFVNGGQSLKFKITANSTQRQTSVRDVLKITYLDEHGFKKETEIQIEIKNEKRVESVRWLNQTEDGEIYLNLTTTVSSERSFTISTSVSPSDANDIGLSYVYFPVAGSSNDLSITTSTIGQTFNLNINTKTGGYGSMYLLPNDMIKVVDGVKQVLVYKYSTDQEGNIVEVPVYKRLSELYSYYSDMIDDKNEEFSTYFYNNDGEKIYYKDIIIKIDITIADGSSEGTAIRIYNAEDMRQIDTAKYYKIMNDITLNEWKSYDEFSGMFFGNDDTVTIHFGSGKSFVNKLTGTIKNLIFTGNVSASGIENGGLVVNENKGLIENVSVDVYYSDGHYKSSVLDGTASNMGILAGSNDGTIRNSFAYGTTINATNATYVGGIVGNNNGTIDNCGFEFYSFESKTNQIDGSGATIGGIVGFIGENGLIKNSYAYAYPLVDGDHDYTTIIKGKDVSAFAGSHASGAKIENSFAYLGTLKTPTYSSTNATYINFKNVYLSYNVEDGINSRIFTDVSFAYGTWEYNAKDQESEDKLKEAYVLNESDIPSDYNDKTTWSAKWTNMGNKTDNDVWETTEINAEVNFGFIHLKNISQSAEVNVENVRIKDVDDTVLKAMEVRDSDGKETDKGILFVYKPTATITDVAENSALESLNTISIAELFGVSSEQARSLLLTTDSKNISISSTSIKVLSKNIQEFSLFVHSKMNFASSKEFKVVVLNYLPELQTTLEDNNTLKENQTIMVQTGLNNARTVTYALNSTIYLNGTEYATEKDDFSVGYIVDENSENYMSVSKSYNTLTFVGQKSHSEKDSYVESYVMLGDLDSNSDYQNAIKKNRARKFYVSVYNGATSLNIENASALIVKPSQYAVFDVVLKTDDEKDNLVLGLMYENIDIKSETATENSATFVVDDNLTLDASWVKNKVDGGYRFKVVVKVSEDSKHKILESYDNLTICVNAKSQESNTKFIKQISLSVKTQEIEDITILTYNIKDRQIKYSTLYLRPSGEITNTLIPGSDAIIAVAISPAYSKMTHFTLTYSITGSGNVGTVTISRLSYNSLYGYYVNSNSTSLLTNGIRVNLTDKDKTGDGVYYFRLYVSSTFKTNSDIKLSVNYYYDETPLISATHNLSVDYLQSASVKVEGASTYMISKGSSATATITVDLNQEVKDVYLKNNHSNISLVVDWTPEVFSTYKVYTAYITTYVDAKLEGGENGEGKDSGIFYICAEVERTINNSSEIKMSYATLCLVDFSIDGQNIKVAGGGSSSTYQGKNYDAFYTYIGSQDRLYFDYPMISETYNYDKNNSEEVKAVNTILEKRNQFSLTNYYQDEEAGYYINYQYNESLGEYEELSLKQQLWYATDENNATAICNKNGIIQHDIFTFEEIDNNQTKYLSVSGKRTGKQLMMLRTTVVYQGLEFVYDYYFLIVVEIWSDEDTPTQIFTGEQFVEYATESENADDYILMADIILDEYSPVDTDLIKSLDGNGYTIHINSFAMPTDTNSLKLALFDVVDSETTLKNVRVNIYNGGQIVVDISQYKSIEIAGFALENNGVIYNCEVVSYYDEDCQSSAISSDTGLVVKYVNGANSDPIILDSATIKSMGIDSNVAGFVLENNASVLNSRVGGESLRRIVEIAGMQYLRTQELKTFVVEGQGVVAGFVYSNSSTGNISACFVDNVQIYNKLNATTSITSGFAIYNNNSIQSSYVEGVGGAKDEEGKTIVYNNITNISANGIIAGFVYENTKLVKNSYANIAFENNESKGSLVSGFVYKNQSGAEINLCYSACEILKTDSNQTQFSGIDDFGDSLNYGTIKFSYYYNKVREESTTQSKISTGAFAVKDITEEDTFYGFSFASGDDANDGIWKFTENGITLVSANNIAFSNRYSVTTNKITNLFYNKSIIDATTMEIVDLSYGSENNPIIIRSAYDFAMATGKANSSLEISSYKEYYNDEKVFGNYRIVNDIDMSGIDQNSESLNSIKLTTTTKTFTGMLDGNGFTISNINLGSNLTTENYGLFAKLDGAVIMNLGLIVDSIHNSHANIVGTLAGTAVDSRILAISLTPTSSGDSLESKTSILGNNVVGGVVGMLFGESRLSDISVKDIDVYSSYYLKEKKVGDNDEYLGATLRNIVENGGSLESNIVHVSYAGAIAGYVDVYDSVDDVYTRFYSSLEVSDYDIVTVHVTDSVNIYGEVAGGLFGYVGKSTLIYDATIELDSDMNLSKPSYIISKNLYSGGIIGENYGGLFAVSASYSEDLQDTIESGENGYYGGNLSAEVGQQSIFSYTQNDEGFDLNRNDPLYIGGLVGYMGGGYIYVGYNKLNVISHSDSTLAVGGVIGYAGYKDTLYEVSFVNTAPKVNIFLNDVYASGDVYVDGEKGVSAGIIGALERSTNGTGTSIVGLKNVLAVNYYSYNGGSLVGDVASLKTKNSEVEEYVEEYLSDRHFILIGNILTTSGDKVEVELSSNIYLIDSENNAFDVSKGIEKDTIGSLSVGGYATVKVGEKTNLNLSPYGFDVSWGVRNDVETIYRNILQTESIGSSTMSTMASAYARMYSYFIPIGWENEYWNHEEEHLFPDIELTPKLNIVFWDCYNTDTVLQEMKNDPAITVVVRGKTEKSESSNEYKDIDLRTGKGDLEGTAEIISGFKGTLISYYEYMDSDVEGLVTEEVKDGKIVIGGNAAEPNVSNADRVGIILEKSLFKNLESGASVEGISFYLYPKDDKGFSIVEESANMTIFKNVNIVVNKAMTLKTQLENTSSGQIYTTGLIAKSTYSTSFVDIDIKVRGDDTSLTFIHDSEIDDVYMGLLAGYIEQRSSYTQVNVSGVSITKETAAKNEESTKKIDINFKVAEKSWEGLYLGVYAGKILKGKNAYSKISVGIESVGNVNLNIGLDKSASAGSKNMSNVYIGGLVGEIESVDNVVYDSTTENGEALSIIQKMDIKSLSAGLCFGKIANCGNLVIMSDKGLDGCFEGAIYQYGNVSSEVAKIGGIAGEVNSRTVVQGFSVELNVGKLDVPTYKITEDSEEYIFDKNSYDYSKYLNPYVVVGSTDDGIGGFFGDVSGATIEATGNCKVCGIIDVEVNKVELKDAKENALPKVVSIGGLIGKSSGDLKTEIALQNELNISVRQEDLTQTVSAYIGGIVGLVVNVNAGEDVTRTISINEKNLFSGGVCEGNVLVATHTLVFGGAVGYVENVKTKTTIKNFVYGGAVRIYGRVETSGYKLSNSITVGGVVGAFGGCSEECLIEKCSVYGDLFVNYYEGNYNEKFETYNFGGIVGSASTNENKLLTVSNCASLMTSFNERLTSELGNLNANAIVGKNSSGVKYENNLYSSSVCLAYQEEDGNTDTVYGNNGTYKYCGYTSKVSGEENIPVSSSTNILGKFSVDTNNLKIGHKLKPYEWDKDDTIVTKINDIGNLHDISWIALVEDIEIESSIASDFKNYAFVGNGHSITRSDSKKNPTGDAGGLVDTISACDSGTGYITNYSLIAGFIMNLEISTTDVVEEKSFGGVAGSVLGKAFIYGVGVQGKLSVGVQSSDKQIYLGGLVGTMARGMISECYMDADVTYRGGKNGIVCGIAKLDNSNTTIRNTYSSGLIETYVDAEIYTFAKSLVANDSVFSSDVLDCYSVSQFSRNDTMGETFNNTIYFGNVKNVNDYGLSILGTVINGSVGVANNPNNSATILNGESLTMSLSYSEYISPKSVKSLICSGDKESYSTWFFNSYVNYGYASHGFGYLKNVTTYTREGEIKAEGSVLTLYKYKAVSYEYILNCGKDYGENNPDGKEWYLSVPNETKFNQMVATVGKDSLYAVDYKFVLKYGFDIASTSIGKDIGKSDENLVIDGQGNTINFNNVETMTGLFGVVNGTIENLRITNINIKNTLKTMIGGLASELYGSATSITVTGEITSENNSGGYVGGVVGYIFNTDLAKENIATLTNLNSYVNITIEENTKGLNRVGGIVGYAYKTNLTDCSNSGMIVNANLCEGPLISGGIVGDVLSYVTVTNCYNANAVLTRYTNSAAEGWSYSGGIVGYTGSNTTIENCYNTGLIGAGNYSMDNYERQYAGGIISYALSENVEIKNCINDGAVEAINKMGENVDYEISIENMKDVSGHVLTAYLSAPSKVEIKVKITYNLNRLRSVYANGIGYLTSGSTVSGCQSSDDNIKNDGMLGEFFQESTITLDRNRMLDNDASKSYQGMFKMDNKSASTYEPNLYINGIDNYGTPTRLYVKDTMTRRLKSTVLNLQNIVEKRYYNNWVLSTMDSIYNIESETRTSAEDLSDLVSGIWDETKPWLLSGDPYHLEASTTYYSSAEFTAYDDFVKGAGPIGNFAMIGTEVITQAVSNEDIAATINRNISELQKKKEDNSNLTECTINGEKVAFVWNSGNLTAVEMPYSYSITAQFTIANLDKVEFSERDITFDITDLQYSKVNSLSKSSNPVTVYATLYFAEKKDSQNVKVGLTYTYKYSVELAKNNVIVSETETETRIYLDNFGYDNSKKIVDAWFVEGDVETDSIMTNIQTNNGFAYGSEGNYYIIYTGKDKAEDTAKDTATKLKGKTLKLEFQKEEDVTSSVDLTVNPTTTTTENKIGDLYTMTETETETYVGYEEIGKEAIAITYLNIDTDGAYYYDLEKLRKNVFNDTDKVVFGNNNHKVWYSGGSWSFETLDTDSIVIEIIQNKLYFRTESKTNEEVLAFIKAFATTGYMNKVGNVEKSDKSKTISTTIDNSYNANIGLKLKDNNAFSGITAYGSNFDKVSGDGITTEKNTILGVDFYTHTVTYNYESASMTINFANKGGYEVKVTAENGTTKSVLQTAVINTQKTVELSDVQDSDTISISKVVSKFFNDDGKNVEEFAFYEYDDTEIELFYEYEDTQNEIRYIIEYLITKGTAEKCDACDKECSYVKTTKEEHKYTKKYKTVSNSTLYSYTLYDCGHSKITGTGEVDLIVGDFNKNNIVFVRNGVEGLKFTAEGTGKKNVNRYAESVLNYGYTTSEIISRPTTGYVENSFKYKIDNGDWKTDKNLKTTLDADSYSVSTYTYQYKVFLSKNITLGESSGKTIEAKKIILKDDIYLGNISFKSNEKDIIGSGYVLSFVELGNSLFGINKNPIRNLIVAMQNSLRTNTGDFGGLANENEKIISNVSILGNIRNVSATSSSRVVVKPTFASNEQNLKITSYVSMTGLDTKAENNYAATLENCDSENENLMELHDVLIAGNGTFANGKNQKDTYEGGNLKSKNNESGDDGVKGGYGGSVSTSSNTCYRVGHGSIGGYGGNGGNGYFDGEKLLSLGGGGGGAPGTNGTNGTYTKTTLKEGTITTSSTFNATTSTNTTTTFQDKQYGGNGGVGGLGRISGSCFYTSGGGGAAGGYINYVILSGKAGNPGTQGQTKYGYGKTAYTAYLQSGKCEGVANSNNYKIWYGFDYSALDSAYTSSKNNYNQLVGGSGGSIGIVNGGQTKVTKLYMRIQTADPYNSKKFIWTSGETINSGGSFGMGLYTIHSKS